MDGKEMRQKLFEVFGEELRINKDFQDCFDNLKEGMKEELFQWCLNCKNGSGEGSTPPIKEYKELFVFFRKIGDNTRAILIKRKNDGFIEIMLTNHKYYDEKRAELGYKNSGYYGS